MDQQRDIDSPDAADLAFERWLDSCYPPMPVPLEVLERWIAEDQLREQDEQAELYWLHLRAEAA